MDVKKVLYISYDGLTDPLGQSQILPYLKGLSQYGYQFTILSFEKADRFQKEKGLIDRLTKESNIEWVPLTFTAKPPLLSKFYDAVRMRNKAIALYHKTKFDMVHCRSYVAAEAGLLLKKKFGVKFFFDMRGFWADEKKDGSWDVNNPVFKRVYKYYKNKETQFLQHADYIISLTEAGKKEMSTWASFNKEVPISVIPCCADMEHFSLTNLEQKQNARKILKINDSELVISYLGSVGTWYMLDEMLLFFKQVKKQYADAKFLFITHSPRHLIDQQIAQLGLHPEDFIITPATRKEVPELMKASDINLSFIKPVYSKISSSPTKLGEVLSMGIPVICNSGVGDVKKIVEETESGIIIDNFKESDFQLAVESIPDLLQKSPSLIRAAAKKIYDLQHGIELYEKSYKKVLP